MGACMLICRSEQSPGISFVLQCSVWALHHKGLSSCTYLAVSGSFFHKIPRTEVNPALQRFTLCKGKNSLAYLLMFCKFYLSMYFPWLASFSGILGQEPWVTSRLYHPSRRSQMLSGLPTTHSYLDFSEGDLKKAVYSFFISFFKKIIKWAWLIGPRVFVGME